MSFQHPRLFSTTENCSCKKRLSRLTEGHFRLVRDPPQIDDSLDPRLGSALQKFLDLAKPLTMELLLQSAQALELDVCLFINACLIPTNSETAQTYQPQIRGGRSCSGETPSQLR
jgi:hypothetical protein